MKIALISVTQNGVNISGRIIEYLESNHFCTQYTFQKYFIKNTVSFGSLRDLTANIFYKYDALVYICACGAVVRMIAPHLISKLTDPAVVVVDEQGKFVISLISGHIGKANALTRKIADFLNAIPVITTATDIGGKFSPDSFASANNLHICEIHTAKEIAAAVLNGKLIGIKSNYDMKNIPSCFGENPNLGICISDNISLNPFKRTLHLVPKNIAVGIGCKRNIEPDKLETFILQSLERNNIPLWKIGSINTIDIKKNEKAILEFSEKYHCSLKYFSADYLMNIDGNFEGSAFVLKTVGTDNVSERSACAGGGHE